MRVAVLQNHPQVDACQAQLMCGSLKLDVARLVTDGVLTWQDTMHPAQPLAAADAGEVRTRTARSRQRVGAPQHAVSCLGLPWC